MPYLNIRSNVALDEARRGALLAHASRLVADTLGKPERYVMVSLDDDRPMLFDASGEPAAYLELRSISLPVDRAAEISGILCRFMAEELGIDPARIYIELADAPRSLWGWNGATF